MLTTVLKTTTEKKLLLPLKKCDRLKADLIWHSQFLQSYPLPPLHIFLSILPQLLFWRHLLHYISYMYLPKFWARWETTVLTGRRHTKQVTEMPSYVSMRMFLILGTAFGIGEGKSKGQVFNLQPGSSAGVSCKTWLIYTRQESGAMFSL